MEELKDFEVVKELLETKQYTKLRQFLAEMNDACTRAINVMKMFSGNLF